MAAILDYTRAIHGFAPVDYEQMLSSIDEALFREYNADGLQKRKASAALGDCGPGGDVDARPPPAAARDPPPAPSAAAAGGAADPLAALPQEVAAQILLHLGDEDLVSAACVSRDWHAAVFNDTVFKTLLHRTFSREQLYAAKGVWDRDAVGAYRALREWHQCGFCDERYRAGDNTPDSCGYHSGVLFSGGVVNGIALYWTCCNLSPSSHESGKRFQPRGCQRQRHFNANCVFDEAQHAACAVASTAGRSTKVAAAAPSPRGARRHPPSWLPPPDKWRPNFFADEDGVGAPGQGR